MTEVRAIARRGVGGMRAAAALAGVAAVVVGPACSRPVASARLDRAEPMSAAETRAAERQRTRRCSDRWSLLLPGLGQMCRGKRAEAGWLMAAGAVELGTGIWVGRERGFNHPGAAVPLLAFQDLWIYANTEPVLDRALARGALYAPRDTLADMLAAPFNAQVLGRTDVWAGTLALVAVGVGASWLLAGEDLDTGNAGGDPDVFGRTFDRRIGYPLGVAAGAGLFSHVAIAEEALFRGVVQSHLARTQGEWQGWLWASLAFGLAHSFNIVALPEGERGRYLTYAVPVITGLGSYIGHAYQRADYSLSVPVAIHFWYDLLLSTALFIADPQNSPISASIALRF